MRASNNMITLLAAFRLIGFFALSIIAMGLQSLMLIFRASASRWVPHIYFICVAKLLSMRVRIEGPKPLDRAGLILANHASWLDIVVLSSALPVIFVAKKEVASWPFFGALAKLGGTIFLDRQKRQNTAVACNHMQERMSRGHQVVLFPEGTTSDGNRVLPFRSALLGAANGNLAENAVVPALITYWGRYGLPMSRSKRSLYAWFGEMTLPQHLWGIAKNGPFDVILRFYPPIDLSAGRKIACHHAETLLSQELARTLNGQYSVAHLQK